MLFLWLLDQARGNKPLLCLCVLIFGLSRAKDAMHKLVKIGFLTLLGQTQEKLFDFFEISVSTIRACPPPHALSQREAQSREIRAGEAGFGQIRPTLWQQTFGM
jgi:hypothetical protein